MGAENQSAWNAAFKRSQLEVLQHLIAGPNRTIVIGCRFKCLRVWWLFAHHTLNCAYCCGAQPAPTYLAGSAARARTQLPQQNR
ncbi:hypothetical protein DAD99_13275 [Pseudarthrobacter sp. AB1]|nr:hypothetical protein [Pseudarthrobacter sp. AB1]